MTEYIAKIPDDFGNIHFLDSENHVWQQLITRQEKVIQTRAAKDFLAGLDILEFPIDQIPQLSHINVRLEETTGWCMVPVAGTIQVEEFFQLLSNKKFPAATFIRRMEELDYLTQPDLFHEYFGHGPMLTNQAYADFLEWYGNYAKTLSKAHQKILSRLFWYTIEFGLIKDDGDLKIFGGGILSSYEETLYAADSKEPERLQYDLETIVASPYNYQEIQKKYFILESIEQLYSIQSQKNLKDLLQAVELNYQKGFINC